jgi:hypothetical protein
MKKKILLIAAFVLSLGSMAHADLYATNNHFYTGVANHNGIKYNMDYSYYESKGTNGLYANAASGKYLVKADGGGQNELKISSATTGGTKISESTSSGSYTGSFYITNSGGRGFDNDIIMLLAVKGNVASDFSFKVKSAGYEWTPAAQGAYNPTLTFDSVSTITGIDTTFYANDFMGTQSATKRPGPSGWSRMYNGEPDGDTSTWNLMLIDLYAGNIKSTYFPGQTLENNGAVKVEFAINGLYDTLASINAYGWCSAANQESGINWTNDSSGGFNGNGFVLTSTAAAPVPIPAAVWLLGSGFSGLFFIRRRNTQA